MDPNSREAVFQRRDAIVFAPLAVRTRPGAA